MAQFFSMLVRGAEDVQRAFDLKAIAARKAAALATREAVELIREEVDKRTLLPKRLSIQDTNAPRYLSQRKPIQTYVNEQRNEGLVVLGRHWTPARTPAMLSLGGKELERSGLKIPRDTYIKGAHGYFQGRTKATNALGKSTGPARAYIFMRFSKFPDLASWADRQDKGMQRYKHAIRITPEIGQQLITSPAVERNRARVLSFYTERIGREFQ